MFAATSPLLSYKMSTSSYANSSNPNIMARPAKRVNASKSKFDKKADGPPAPIQFNNEAAVQGERKERKRGGRSLLGALKKIVSCTSRKGVAKNFSDAMDCVEPTQKQQRQHDLVAPKPIPDAVVAIGPTPVAPVACEPKPPVNLLSEEDSLRRKQEVLQRAKGRKIAKKFEGMLSSEPNDIELGHQCDELNAAQRLVVMNKRRVENAAKDFQSSPFFQATSRAPATVVTAQNSVSQQPASVSGTVAVIPPTMSAFSISNREVRPPRSRELRKIRVRGMVRQAVYVLNEAESKRRLKRCRIVPPKVSLVMPLHPYNDYVGFIPDQVHQPDIPEVEEPAEEVEEVPINDPPAPAPAHSHGVAHLSFYVATRQELAISLFYLSLPLTPTQRLNPTLRSIYLNSSAVKADVVVGSRVSPDEE
ncbi:hypothetical protein D9613_010573 [Agrocybe pediades]|uniref:Uncharacterized protein n=1 Tax=Agrocybe pediades TaxID=84607 RepID=A0A8H4QFK6_9AGAR|nr:hypothetical protein D9613_010573 [Agrocybe pediades]